MEFGVFILAQQRGYHQTSSEVIHNSIEQTVVAEQAGFNAAWYAEHHFNNYSLSPSPLMTVAHAAGKTSRIRLGTAVCILPLYHPARFLAEVGFVDTVSNGRLELGVGSGYQEFEFERFGVKLAEAGAIYNEFLDILPKALTQKVFEYEGKFLRVPPSSLAVRCVQQPLPPIWVTSGNPLTLGRAVREGHNLFVTSLLNGNDAIANLRGRLEKIAVRQRQGPRPRRQVRLPALRLCLRQQGARSTPTSTTPASSAACPRASSTAATSPTTATWSRKCRRSRTSASSSCARTCRSAR